MLEHLSLEAFNLLHEILFCFVMWYNVIGFASGLILTPYISDFTTVIQYNEKLCMIQSCKLNKMGSLRLMWYSWQVKQSKSLHMILFLYFNYFFGVVNLPPCYSFCHSKRLHHIFLDCHGFLICLPFLNCNLHIENIIYDY